MEQLVRDVERTMERAEPRTKRQLRDALRRAIGE
jgi:hypothetical protein